MARTLCPNTWHGKDWRSRHVVRMACCLRFGHRGDACVDQGGAVFTQPKLGEVLAWLAGAVVAAVLAVVLAVLGFGFAPAVIVAGACALVGWRRAAYRAWVTRRRRIPPEAYPIPGKPALAPAFVAKRHGTSLVNWRS